MSSVNDKLRTQVWNEYKGYCAVCGGKIAHFSGIEDDCYAVDHFIPKAKFGVNVIENLVCTCRKCNSEKRDYIIDPRIAYPYASPTKIAELLVLMSLYRKRHRYAFTMIEDFNNHNRHCWHCNSSGKAYGLKEVPVMSGRKKSAYFGDLKATLCIFCRADDSYKNADSSWYECAGETRREVISVIEETRLDMCTYDVESCDFVWEDYKDGTIMSYESWRIQEGIAKSGEFSTEFFTFTDTYSMREDIIMKRWKKFSLKENDYYRLYDKLCEYLHKDNISDIEFMIGYINLCYSCNIMPLFKDNVGMDRFVETIFGGKLEVFSFSDESFDSVMKIVLPEEYKSSIIALNGGLLDFLEPYFNVTTEYHGSLLKTVGSIISYEREFARLFPVISMDALFRFKESYRKYKLVNRGYQFVKLFIERLEEHEGSAFMYDWVKEINMDCFDEDSKDNYVESMFMVNGLAYYIHGFFNKGF